VFAVGINDVDAFHPLTRGYARLATLVAPPTLQWLTELLEH
jgi:hypothetical protein